jgi:hypothetical protein
VPLEAWLIAGGLYAALVAITRAANVRELLGFPHNLDGRQIESDAVIDIVSGSSIPALGGIAGPTMEPTD